MQQRADVRSRLYAQGQQIMSIEQWWKDLYAQWASAYPNITVQEETVPYGDLQDKLQTYIASGDVPDIIMGRGDFVQAYVLGSRDPKLIETISRSEALFLRVVAQAPGSAAPLWSPRGDGHARQLRWAESAADYGQAIRLQPKVLSYSRSIDLLCSLQFLPRPSSHRDSEQNFCSRSTGSDLPKFPD